MFSKNGFFSTIIFFILLLTTGFTRFYGLDWGNGNFFQPDENNMASAVSQFTATNLNPHFFAYGQFPLYLGYLTLWLFHLPNNFENSIYILRTLSAIYGVISIYLFYKISQHLNLKHPLYLLLIIFCPGLIQLSHFGTTESLLVAVYLSTIYLSILYLNKSKIIYIFLASLITGIGLATKISSLIFITPLLLSLIINLFKSKNIIKFLVHSFLFVVPTIIWTIVLSPYNLVEFKDFISSMNYETGVATGKIMVFYTHQFLNSVPYIFQLKSIFPYAVGYPMFILGGIGLFLILRNLKKNLSWFIILFSTLLFLTYFGQVYTKWTRFMSPIFFIFPLLSIYAISKIKNNIIQILLVILCCLPGIYFMKLYSQTDLRLVASDWIVKELPPQSHILSEAGNVVNLPIKSNDLIIDNYDFYNYDPLTLATSLNNSDYIIIPSRRVFKNYDYPYYQHLFDGSLGFYQIQIFTPQVDLLLNSENAEETWSVFDHPTIRIYKKYHQLDISQYENLL